MKKYLLALLLTVYFTIPAMADSLSAQVLPGLFVNVPGSNLSVDTLLNINAKAESPDNTPLQFMAGISSRIITYKQIGTNMGAITNTGFSYRAYYSISYDYVNANPGLLMLINQITVSVFYSTLFDGNPNIYGLCISKKLF